jgi:acyl-coenzyme A synthetase/AMP-(fatty) acid ligase
VVMRGAFDEQALIAHCRDRVGPMSPSAIVALPELPRNAMGKVLRHELSALVNESRAGGDAGKSR